MDSRQVQRRKLFQMFFTRMEPQQPHVTPKRDAHGRTIKGKRNDSLPNRAERRRLARAYAAGEWKKQISGAK